MRERLINLINKYEKRLALPVDELTKQYYQGKIDAYEVSLMLLKENGGDR